MVKGVLGIQEPYGSSVWTQNHSYTHFFISLDNSLQQFFSTKLVSWFLIVLLYVKACQPLIFFYCIAPIQRMLRLYTAFKVLFIQLTLNFKAFYWDNRIYSVRSSLEITAWNAHPGEVMQKMKHICQNKTVVGVTRQSQGKGQWGEPQTGKESLVLLGEKRVKVWGNEELKPT